MSGRDKAGRLLYRVEYGSVEAQRVSHYKNNEQHRKVVPNSAVAIPSDFYVATDAGR